MLRNTFFHCAVHHAVHITPEAISGVTESNAFSWFTRCPQVFKNLGDTASDSFLINFFIFLHAVHQSVKESTLPVFLNSFHLPPRVCLLTDPTMPK
jgi:hypothetical protein